MPTTRKHRRVLAKAKVTHAKALKGFVSSRTAENKKLTGRKNPTEGKIHGSVNSPLGTAGLRMNLTGKKRAQATVTANKIIKKVKANQKQIRQARQTGPRKKK